MRAIELFAGAGGALLGGHRAGLEHVEAVEHDPEACRVLELATGGGLFSRPHEAWGEAPPLTVRCMDVRLWRPVPADLWWTSPPCQPHSPAGRREGPQDARDGYPWVWDAYDRAEHKPAWLVAENVRGLTYHSKDHGPSCSGCYFEQVVQPEARKRFPWVGVWVLNAADYGVPQHRWRVFLACGPRPAQAPDPTHGEGLQPYVTMREALGLAPGERIIGGGHNPNKPGDVRRYNDLTERPSTTIAAQSGGGAGNAGPFVMPERRRLTVRECAILQDFPADWPFCGTDEQRYRQVGNAVPPRLAEVVVRTILNA